MAVTVNAPLTTQGVVVESKLAMAEFDCADDSSNPTIVLIPASLNKNGLIIKRIWALVTEVFAGTEDQGIVTVSDESDNSLGTLTASDASGDAVDAIIQGSGNSTEDATGTALTTVAAGEYVDAVVTQQTTGACTGKMLVCVEYIAVPSKE